MMSRLIPLGLLFASLAAAAPVERAAAVSSEKLVEELGDDRYPVRVRASQELWQRGDAVLPLLEEAMKSGNPESATRARSLWRKIRIGVTPESPEAVIGLVESYEGASPEERQRIVGQLKRLEAWRPLLRLQRIERDPATLDRIRREMDGVSVAAAREVLQGEKPDYATARELLELAPAEPGPLMALADFHRARGTLNEELAKAKQLEGLPGHVWRSILYAAADRPQDAAREAEAAGRPVDAARYHLLAGDPRPWVRRVEVPEGQIAPDTIDDYREAVCGLWDGRPVPDGLVRALVSSVRGPYDDESWHSMGVLYALGRFKEADEILVKLSPTTAFAYFDSVERIDDALRALGIDPANPDYEGWLSARLAPLVKEPEDYEGEMEEVKLVGGFLERRGLEDVLDRALRGPLVEIGRKSPERFLDLVGELFTIYASGYENGRISGPVIGATAELGADDPEFVQRVLARMFGDGIHVAKLWESMDGFVPDAGLEERIRLTAVMLGQLPDTKEDARRWWAWQLERGHPEALDERLDYWGLMLSVSLMDTDAERFLEIEKMTREDGFDPAELGGFSEEFRFETMRLVCLSALGHWKEVAEAYLSEDNGNADHPLRLARLAAVQRLAGDEDSAGEIESRLDCLVLGDTRLMLQIGSAYQFFGDYRRSAEWWRRGAMESVTGDAMFMNCCDSLRDEAIEAAQWSLAAALRESNLLFDVMDGSEYERPATAVRGRMEVEMARSLSLLGSDRKRALADLERSREMDPNDGSMADYFFAPLREAGLTDLHDRWFEQSWKHQVSVLDRFPGSYNTMNSVAWIASKANRRLDEAERWLKRALEIAPRQAAYLDTMAEIQFARRDREEAIEWSTVATRRAPGYGGSGLARQHHRFLSGPFPPK